MPAPTTPSGTNYFEYSQSRQGQETAQRVINRANEETNRPVHHEIGSSYTPEPGQAPFDYSQTQQGQAAMSTAIQKSGYTESKPIDQVNQSQQTMAISPSAAGAPQPSPGQPVGTSAVSAPSSWQIGASQIQQQVQQQQVQQPQQLDTTSWQIKPIPLSEEEIFFSTNRNLEREFYATKISREISKNVPGIAGKITTFLGEAVEYPVKSVLAWGTIAKSLVTADNPAASRQEKISAAGDVYQALPWAITLPYTVAFTFSGLAGMKSVGTAASTTAIKAATPGVTEIIKSAAKGAVIGAGFQTTFEIAPELATGNLKNIPQKLSQPEVQERIIVAGASVGLVSGAITTGQAGTPIIKGKLEQYGRAIDTYSALPRKTVLGISDFISNPWQLRYAKLQAKYYVETGKFAGEPPINILSGSEIEPSSYTPKPASGNIAQAYTTTGKIVSIEIPKQLPPSIFPIATILKQEISRTVYIPRQQIQPISRPEQKNEEIQRELILPKLSFALGEKQQIRQNQMQKQIIEEKQQQKQEDLQKELIHSRTIEAQKLNQRITIKPRIGETEKQIQKEIKKQNEKQKFKSQEQFPPIPKQQINFALPYLIEPKKIKKSRILKLPKPRYGYTPSVLGVILGKKERRIKKSYSGLEIRGIPRG